MATIARDLYGRLDRLERTPPDPKAAALDAARRLDAWKAAVSAYAAGDRAAWEAYLQAHPPGPRTPDGDAIRARLLQKLNAMAAGRTHT